MDMPARLAPRSSLVARGQDGALVGNSRARDWAGGAAVGRPTEIRGWLVGAFRFWVGFWVLYSKAVLLKLDVSIG